MKLATLKNGSRDGRLVVVSKDLTRCTDAARIAPTLQAALDDWDTAAPRLARMAEGVELGSVPTFRFHEHDCESPLPRAFQWADGSAYINHVELVRKARGAEVPDSFYEDPLMYQGGSDAFLGPRDDIPLGDVAWGCDMEGEIAVVTDDVPMGVSEAEAADHIKLIMLCNDVSLRGLIPAELAKSFGFFNSKPSTAFSPFAVTPDELGDAFQEGRVHLHMETTYNGTRVGRVHAGPEMHFSFFDLIAHISKTRPFTAGTILGSGTISNADRSAGISCLAERRMIEIIETGAAQTPFMAVGDSVSIEMHNAEGQNIFGTIAQKVVAS
ncbi:MAG: fumarylacetoacetate hydrolase family protein [Myxococcota bacterium]